LKKHHSAQRWDQTMCETDKDWSEVALTPPARSWEAPVAGDIAQRAG